MSDSVKSSPRADSEPAGYGVRLAALVIDWLLCLLIANGMMSVGWLPEHDFLWPSVVLVVEYAVFLGFFTQTPGMRVARIHCVHISDSGPLGVPRALTRGVLLALTLPALTAFVDPDRRGLHDRAGGSIVVR